MGVRKLQLENVIAIRFGLIDSQNIYLLSLSLAVAQHYSLLLMSFSV